MSIRDVLVLVNQMLADGVIEQYAIGGAVGATFFLEPVTTLDVDIFVPLHAPPGSLLVSPQPIFDYLKMRGGQVKGEYIELGGWPIQFLPPTGPLVEEALTHIVKVDVQGVTARVLSAEYLAAIALQTGRSKDKARLLQFLESGTVKVEIFEDIVSRHGLTQAWTVFRRQFFGNQP